MRARARVHFVETAAGGRSGLVRSGYIALVGVGGVRSSAAVRLLSAELARPGEVHDVELTFANPGYVGDRARPGVPITFNEGKRTVAEGVILEAQKEEEDSSK